MLYFTNKMECFSFTSGCVVRVAKRFIEDWFIVLQKPIAAKSNFAVLAVKKF